MRTLLAAAILAVALPAAADPTPPRDVTKMASDDCARARAQNKTCVLTIEDETVEGGVPTVSETPIAVIGFGGHGSLIRVRRDFIPEILKTAEDL